MSDDLVKRAEEAMNRIRKHRSISGSMAFDLIRDLLADRRETALQYLSDMGQAVERLDTAVKQAREDALREAAAECKSWRDSEYPTEEEAIGATQCASLILALITKDTPK